MNFLAHIYLSGDDQELAFGNFIGDFVKGNYKDDFPERVVMGIALHRKIDQFTDGHDIFKKSKSRLSQIYGHYPPVIIDIFYDHILARNWEQYHRLPLIDFTAQFYDYVQLKQALIPERGKELFRYMVKQNWLYNYSRIEGIEKTFQGLARRTSFDSNMEKATHDLVRHYNAFESDFNLFLPQVTSFVKDFLKKH